MSQPVRPLHKAMLAVAILFTIFTGGVSSSVLAQNDCQSFSQTGHSVCGRFLQYWNEHGGLAQQGYPISDVIGEVSSVDGKTYTVQYFERAVFEYHPGNQPPNDVLLSLLGAFAYASNYVHGAPNQTSDISPSSQVFAQTGKHLGGEFLHYWQTHGSLTQQGYPISDVFVETSRLDGKPYQVQYFERAVFELHPENPSASRVLLSQLGTFRYQGTYGSKTSTLAPPVILPSALPSPGQSGSTQPQQPPPPSQPPAATPTTKPIPPQQTTLTITKAPGIVSPGSNASVSAKTAPNASCSIDVEYKSGSSTAAGLYDKQADASGFVSWTWKVGTRTTPGDWPVYITCNGVTATTYVQVR
jgi:hypothetical protein